MSDGTIGAITGTPKNSTTIVATLQTPARPLMPNFVADFGGSGVPKRISAGIDTVEFVDQVKLTGHYSASSVAYLVAYDPETYDEDNTDIAPALTTVLSAGQSRSTQESITGGPLDTSDFSNFVNKMPRRYGASDQLAIQEGELDTDARSLLVRVDNIRDIMTELLDATDLKGPLSVPWQDPIDQSLRQEIENYLLGQVDKQSVIEKYEEMKANREKEQAYRQLNGKPGQPEPIDEKSPTLEMLTPEEQAMVRELAARDLEVRNHEMSHVAAGVGVTSGATFIFQQGPDGKQYAIGGEVKIRLQSGSTPEETLQRAQQVLSAATAPENPSAADLQVAGMATRMQQEARIEMSNQLDESFRTATEESAANQRNVTEETNEETMEAGRLPDEITQLAAMEELERQNALREEGNEAPIRLDLDREVERLTVAAPMGAYGEHFKLEQELDRRSFASLEMAQEVVGVPTQQVVESRSKLDDEFDKRIERHAEVREEIQKQTLEFLTTDEDVESKRFDGIADRKEPGTIDGVASRPLEVEAQLQKIKDFAGLGSDVKEDLEVKADIEPIPERPTPFATLDSVVETRKEQRDISNNRYEQPKNIRTGSFRGTAELLPTSTSQTLFEPERSPIDFSQQLVTDSQMASFMSLDAVGPTKLSPQGLDIGNNLLSPQEKQSLETQQAVAALEGLFSVQE